MHFQDDQFHKLECKIHGFVYMIRPQGGKAYLGVLDWACGLRIYMKGRNGWLTEQLATCCLTVCYFHVFFGYYSHSPWPDRMCIYVQMCMRYI